MGVSKPYFSHLATLTSTFQAQHDLDLKCKIVSLNGKTIVSLYINPISHGCPITLFQLLTIWTSTFQAQYDLDYKRKFVNLNCENLQISSDLNHFRKWLPFGHFNHNQATQPLNSNLRIQYQMETSTLTPINNFKH